MSFLNLLWIYIINEKWKQYKLSKTNKEQKRTKERSYVQKIDDMFGKRTKEN